MAVSVMLDVLHELGLMSESSSQLLISGDVLCWSLGTLLLGPLSEVHGGPALLHSSRSSVSPRQFSLRTGVEWNQVFGDGDRCQD